MARGRGNSTPQDNENKRIIAENIRKYLKEKKLKQIDLSKNTDIPKNTISDYVNGRTLPNAGNIQKISDYFNVFKSDIDPRFSDENVIQLTQAITSTTEIMKELKQPRQENVYEYAVGQKAEQDREETVIPFPQKKEPVVEEDSEEYLIEVPYFDRAVSAGTGNYIVDEQKETISIPSESVPNGTDFALLVDGDSMEPNYQDGDYIFVRQTPSVDSGNVGVFILNDDAYMKQLEMDENGAYLHSFNSKYKDIAIHENDRVFTVGEVLGRFAAVEE